MRTVLGEDRDEIVEKLAELFEDEVNSIEELIDSEETSNQKSPEEEEEPGVQQSLWGFQKLSELRDKWGSDQNKHVVMFLVAVSLLNVSHRSIETILQYLPVDIKKRRQLRDEFHKILKQIEDREQDVPESHEERQQRAEWAPRIQKVYFCRKGCKAFYQEDNSLCEFCGLNVETSGDYFRYFSPMEYIRYLYSNSAGAEGLKAPDVNERKEGVYSDVWDGSWYKDIMKEEIASTLTNKKKAWVNGARYFETAHELCLELFTDGINPWTSKHEEHTVFALVIHNLPSGQRFHNDQVFIPMIIPYRCLKYDGDAYSFLKLLIDDFALMSSGFRVFDADTKETILVKAHLSFVGGGMPAVSKMMGFKGVQGDYPCRACEKKKV